MLCRITVALPCSPFPTPPCISYKICVCVDLKWFWDTISVQKPIASGAKDLCTPHKWSLHPQTPVRGVDPTFQTTTPGSPALHPGAALNWDSKYDCLNCSIQIHSWELEIWPFYWRSHKITWAALANFKHYNVTNSEIQFVNMINCSLS